MPLNEMKTEFQGHQIAVRNAWGFSPDLKGGFAETKLYVDGEVVDSYGQLLGWSAKVPLLRGSIKEEGKVHIIEVYARFKFRFQGKICIDGKKVTGDLD
jgi:hypothetical protein